MPRLAVLGYPVSHSRSPAMQNAALKAMGLDDWSYEAIEVRPEDFKAKVRELAADGKYAGANVTVPHKEAALAVAGETGEPARQIGAANTLVFGDGGIRAENTDAPGLLAALPGGPQGVRALVLGAGGAARAAVWALTKAGAVVFIWNRTAGRADSLYEQLGSYIKIGGWPIDSPDEVDFGLLVNTTTVGLHGEDPFEELPLQRDAFPGTVVVDMVYSGQPSTLLMVAEERGATTVDGLEILVQQGAFSLKIWTGREPDLDVMRAAARGR